jgi:hypothetical protein
LWSIAHHSFLFGAAILSAAAALILQLKSGISDPARSDWASVCAAIASVIGVVSAIGGFDRKWRTNRLTKARLEELQIDLMQDDFDSAKLRDDIKTMIRAHHAGIVGGGATPEGSAHGRA